MSEIISKTSRMRNLKPCWVIGILIALMMNPVTAYGKGSSPTLPVGVTPVTEPLLLGEQKSFYGIKHGYPGFQNPEKRYLYWHGSYDGIQGEVVGTYIITDLRSGVETSSVGGSPDYLWGYPWPNAVCWNADSWSIASDTTASCHTYQYYTWDARKSEASEYTSNQFHSNVEGWVPAFANTFTEETNDAGINLSADDLNYTITKLQYKFKVNKDPHGTVVWDVKFTPADGSEVKHDIKTWATNGATESPVYTILPWQLNNKQNGNYQAVLLPVDIKVHQDTGLPGGSPPKYKDAPKTYIASNLFSVWPSEQAIVKVKLPPPFDQQQNLPPSLIKWTVPGMTIPDNTLAATMSWGIGLSGNTKEVKVTIGGSDFKLYFKVQGVGYLSELEAAALVPNASPIMLGYRQESIDFGATYPVGPQQDAMRHSYWCSVSASTFPVTASDVELISTGHEYSNRYDDKQQAFNSTMDITNNAVGMMVNHQVNGLPDRPAIQADLEQKYIAGEMYIWEIPSGASSRLQEDSEGILIKSNRTRIIP